MIISTSFSHKNRELLFVLFFCFFTTYGTAQTVIEGTVKDSLKEPVQNATVLIKDSKEKETYAFGSTNTEGYFKITVTQKDSKLLLILRSMGHRTQKNSIANEDHTFNFVLTEDAFELDEVVLKHEPIQQKKDTINYKVNSFSEKSDRSIADVLKHLPGVSVQEDGQILYHGKPINRFYIEDMDLLGGKYNLASENLPHKEVEEVQVLENHQPIKVLDSLSFSDEAALNLKLKNKYTFTGQAELGAGFAPTLWDVNVTPMALAKKRQALVSYQATNSGKDLEREIKPLLSEKPPDAEESNSNNENWLSIPETSPGGLPKERWLNNNAHLVSANTLVELKKKYNLRVNASYLNDYQQQTEKSQTLYFSGADTVPLSENTSNKLYNSMLDVSLRLDKNTKKKYFNDILHFEGYWNDGKGQMTANNNPVRQKLKDHYFSLSNDLSGIFTINKHLLRFNSSLTISETPENLTIYPGQFEELLHEGNPYDDVQQEVSLKKLHTNNSTGFTKRIGRFSISSKVGFDLEYQKLKTNLFVEDELVDQPEFYNNFHWLKNQFFITPKTEFNKGNWRWTIRLPVYYYILSLEDKPRAEKQTQNRFYAAPQLTFRHTYNSKWYMNGSLGHNTSLGGIQQLYPSYILQDYHNINRRVSEVPKTSSNHFSIGIYHKNVLDAIFGNLSYSFMQSNRNLMGETTILPEGALELGSVKKRNTSLNHRLSGEVHKIFSAIRTNVKLNADYRFSRSQFLLNSELAKVHAQGPGISGKVETKFTDGLKLTYNGRFSLSMNKLENQHKQKTYNQSHETDLEINLSENSTLTAATQYFRNYLASGNISSFFADLNYRYTLDSVDFELSYSNIFNNKTYQTSQVSEFQTVENYYVLRPWEVLFKVRFTL